VERAIPAAAIGAIESRDAAAVQCRLEHLVTPVCAAIGMSRLRGPHPCCDKRSRSQPNQCFLHFSTCLTGRAEPAAGSIRIRRPCSPGPEGWPAGIDRRYPVGVWLILRHNRLDRLLRLRRAVVTREQRVVHIALWRSKSRHLLGGLRVGDSPTVLLIATDRHLACRWCRCALCVGVRCADRPE
jgi:hypothetical protein